MGTPGPQKTQRYSLEFNFQAADMRKQPGAIRPVMACFGAT